LHAVGDFDLLEGLFAWMRRSEGIVVGCMPVLDENDVLEMLGGAMNGFDDGIAVGDGERTAGAEIILNVSHEEDVV